MRIEFLWLRKFLWWLVVGYRVATLRAGILARRGEGAADPAAEVHALLQRTALLELAPLDSPKTRETAAKVRELLAPFFGKQDGGGAYHGKGTLALALHYGDAGVKDAAGAQTIRRWVDVLVKEVPTPGTGHFGETHNYGDIDGDGSKEYADRVSIPHVWESALVYLSLMASSPSMSSGRWPSLNATSSARGPEPPWPPHAIAGPGSVAPGRSAHSRSRWRGP